MITIKGLDNAALIATIDLIPLNIFCKDLKGVYCICNKRQLEVAGVQRDSVIGKTDFQCPWMKIAKKLRLDDAVVLGTRTRHLFEDISWVSDGKKYIYLSMKAPICKNSDSEVVGVIGVSIDTTEEEKTNITRVLLNVLRMIQALMANYTILGLDDFSAQKMHVRILDVLNGIDMLS